MRHPPFHAASAPRVPRLPLPAATSAQVAPPQRTAMSRLPTSSISRIYSFRTVSLTVVSEAVFLYFDGKSLPLPHIISTTCTTFPASSPFYSRSGSCSARAAGAVRKPKTGSPINSPHANRSPATSSPTLPPKAPCARGKASPCAPTAKPSPPATSSNPMSTCASTPLGSPKASPPTAPSRSAIS